LPDRFDPKSPLYKRPDGKQRNPYAFCPFLGGKRFCLGKSLAEFVTVFSLPLVLHFLDFEFVNPEHKTHKLNFQIGQAKSPVIPMKITTLRKLPE